LCGDSERLAWDRAGPEIASARSGAGPGSRILDLPAFSLANILHVEGFGHAFRHFGVINFPLVIARGAGLGMPGDEAVFNLADLHALVRVFRAAH